MSKLYSFDPAKKKVVNIGKIVGETLYKNVKPQHFMRIVDGYGIQYQAFQELKVKWIIIKEQNGNMWRASLQDWKDNSKTMDFGNGKQVFLSLRFMKKMTPNLDEKPQIGFNTMQQLAETPEWEKLRSKFHPKRPLTNRV